MKIKVLALSLFCLAVSPMSAQQKQFTLEELNFGGLLGYGPVMPLRTGSPAKMIRAHGKGSIRLGKDADFVLFDDDINVKAVYSAGKKVDL